MRSRIAPIMLAAVLATGCAATSKEVVSDTTAETPASPDIVDPEPAPDDAAEDAAEDAPSEVTVSIGDYFFEPDEVSVEVGDTVTWTHDGDITHNVTSRDGSFTSDNLVSGETFTHTFAEAGSFSYRCTLHGQMIATLDVS